MNNNRLSLGFIKDEVFRVLDEYTSNGIPHEIFSGSTGDIEKRFISALNSAIRLVYLCAARTAKKKRIRLEKPTVSACAENFRLFNASEKKSFDLSETGAQNIGALCISFDFCGSGELTVIDQDRNELYKTTLSSDFGKIETFKGKIAENNAAFVEFSAKGQMLDVKNLIFFGADGALSGIEEELLPDGKRIFCKLSDTFFELKGIFCEKNGFIVEMPEDVFEIENGILSCDEKYAGEYFVEFFEYPEEIDNSAPIDTQILIPAHHFDAVIYATAASLCAREDAELYSRLTYKYREYLSNLYPASNLRFKNSFFSGAFFGKMRKAKSLWR